MHRQSDGCPWPTKETADARSTEQKQAEGETSRDRKVKVRTEGVIKRCKDGDQCC